MNYFLCNTEKRMKFVTHDIYLQKNESSMTTTRLFNSVFLIAYAIGLVLTTACTKPEPQKISLSGNALGTYYSIHYFHSDTSRALHESIHADIDSLLEDFNSTASIYDPQSIISKVNTNIPVEINEMFRDIYTRSQELYALSGGAFDITVGPLVNAWGFGFTDSLHLESGFVDSLLVFVGGDKVKLNGKRIEKTDPRVMLDMNGIAKGYAVDLIANYLESIEITSYIVEIGGEVKAGDLKPDGSSWVVAIEKPAQNATAPQQEEKRIYLENLAVATSGSYRRYYERGGERYSHTINPWTGYPVDHNMISATILAADCMTADALATACMVLGADEAIKLCESIEGVEGFFILDNKKGGWEFISTSGFEKYFEKK